MAADLALLDAEGVGCRVYTWDGPWVTLGRFQKPASALAEGWDRWVVRPTGGKAVLHGHDLTVALAMRVENARDIAAAYRLTVNPIVTALRACGVDAVLAEGRRTRALGLADCFASSAACDVLADDCKVCGCALVISGYRVLLQASIPFRNPVVDPASAIRGALPLEVKPWQHEAFASALEQAIGG